MDSMMEKMAVEVEPVEERGAEEMFVPSSAIEAKDEAGNATLPEPGTVIRADFEGKVTRSGNGGVWFKPDTCNGEPCGAPAVEMVEGDEFETLSKSVEQTDGQGY
jgi:hypothetical protein